ncbi:MAG: leucine-rich repeat protein [Mycoplasma sp.]|nr:leucine-rich repeat protein [Candidatus Hennigella equi]
MKKLHVLIPSLIATASMPLIGLVGCNNPKPEPEPEPVPEYGTFIWKDSANYCTITGYKDDLPNNLLIPGMRNGLPVYIGKHAFYGASIESVTIEDGAQKIEEYAFSHCVNLKSVHLPEQIKSIQQYAFEGCPIHSAYIPRDIDQIGLNPWAGCDLDEISIHPDNSKFKIVNDTLCSLIGSGIYLHVGTNKSIIPTGYNSIGFSDNCFSGLTRLTSLHFPASTITLLQDQFIISNCPNLQEITVDEGAINIATTADEKCLLYDNNDNDTLLFSANKLIPTDTNVKHLGNGSFAFNYYLKDINIPNNIIDFEDGNPFFGCENLQSISVTEATRYIIPEGSNVILDTETNTVVFGNAYSDLTKIGTIENVKIGETAFNWLDNLTAITIPTNITSFSDSFDYSPIATITYQGDLTQWQALVSTSSEWHNHIPCKTIVTTTSGSLAYEAWSSSPMSI